MATEVNSMSYQGIIITLEWKTFFAFGDKKSMDDKIRPNDPEEPEKSPNKAQFSPWGGKEAELDKATPSANQLTDT